MRVVAHPSPIVLEEAVLDRVAAAKAGDPLAPVLVVVPSRRLAEHLARRLVERFGVVFGVEILHHTALARRILETAGVGAPRILGEPLLETLTSRVVRRAPPGPLREFVRDYPTAVGFLRSTLNDLREAGLTPAEVTRAVRGEHAELAALYTEFVAELGRVAQGGCDQAALATMALGHAAAFARRFRAVVHHGAYELIGVHTALVEALDRGCEVSFLRPTRRGDDDPPVPVAASFLDAQGASAELESAARGALAAAAAGVAPHEVAVIVRSFGPYAAAMDALLDADEVRWHTSYTRPLRAERAVAETLDALAAITEAPEARYGEHAAAFEAAARTRFGEEGWNGAAGRTFAALIASLGEIETRLGEQRPVTHEEALAWLTARADEATVPPLEADGGGIRILDAMQARGLTFRHVALVGMNAGVFPIVGRPDPFLPDSARERLTGETGRGLPVASARDAEEHLILSMILGATRDRLAVSWRRADEAGRPVVPSLALRDVARATGTGHSAGDVERAAVSLPAHPRSRLAAWSTAPGMLRRDDETLWIALSSETGATSGALVSARLPALAGGVALVEATDAFVPGRGTYDGRVGSGRVKKEIAATALERLGACPLKFFFRDVLRVEADPEPPTPFEADAAELGRRVHEVLHAVYRTLVDEHAFDRPLAARATRAKEVLLAAWKAKASNGDTDRAARLPVLDGILSARWLAVLGDFIAADLARLEAGDAVPVAFEHGVAKPIPGGPDGLIVKARFDRIVEGGGERIIGDYKTGGRLKERLTASRVLSGSGLQVPLYALLEGAAVELLGVGPKHVPGPGEDPEKVRFVEFAGFKNADHRAGFLETVGVLVALAREGRFPLRSGDHCGYCEYAAACRRTHPPTEFREGHAPDIADARDCWDKGDREPTIAQVRAGRSS